MNTHIDFSRFHEKRTIKGCLVVGDIILDRYIYGDVNRISPEAPVPVVAETSEKFVPGGAANVAGNIRGFNNNVYLAGVLGKDYYGDIIKESIKELDIQYIGLTSSKRSTTVKSRIVGMSQQLLRVDNEITNDITDDEENLLLNNIREILTEVDYVVLSDYNKGVCSKSFCHRFIELCQEHGKKVIVDPKDKNWDKYNGAYLVTPNMKEFSEAVGEKIENQENDIYKTALRLFDKYSIDNILVTRSKDGMTLIEKNKHPLSFQSTQHEVFDVSGAGDTVVATIEAFLTAGYDIKDAVNISNYAAGLAVSKSGTYIVNLDEVEGYISKSTIWYQEKILKSNELEEQITLWKRNNEKIVFTNGCFDILHPGHIEYLNKAKKLGDKLIIGLNSDDSVRRLKGTQRPVNNQYFRAVMLSALQCVDAVIVFDEDTPANLIKAIRPDILVKGGDYQIDEIVGKEYAGKVMTIPFVYGYSTTDIIERIRAQV